MSTQGKYLKLIEQVRQRLAGFNQMSEEIIALTGSRAIGLACENSDYDFYVVYSGSPIYDKKHYTLKVEHFAVDIRCCSLQSIVESNKCYHPDEVQYPSVLYRTSDEQRRSEKITKNVEREDFYRGILYNTLLNDNVWIRRDRQEYYDLFENILNLKSVADYYFTRAYGNFTKFINSQEEVLVRKYLYTLHQIIYCEWLLRKKEFPPFKFTKLLSIVDEELVLDEIYRLYRLNKVANKENNWVLGSTSLNQYINKKLMSINDIMSENEERCV